MFVNEDEIWFEVFLNWFTFNEKYRMTIEKILIYRGKPISKKSFSFGNSTISWWKWIKSENQKNFQHTFSIFFHHNSKKTSHLVRPNNFQSDNIFKCPLFIKSKGWLWKVFVFQIFQSKGYPFTKNQLFLIILIKIHQYLWNFISEKNDDFQRNFSENLMILSKFSMDFSFPFFMIFLEKMTKKYIFKKIKKSKSIQKPWKSRVKNSFGFPSKNQFPSQNQNFMTKKIDFSR